MTSLIVILSTMPAMTVLHKKWMLILSLTYTMSTWILTPKVTLSLHVCSCSTPDASGADSVLAPVFKIISDGDDYSC